MINYSHKKKSDSFFNKVLLFLYLVLPLLQHSQIVYTFSTCGQTGQYGPTQLQANAAYALTNLSGSVTINVQGIQEWTVPYTGTYRINARGANSRLGDPSLEMSGDFNLTAGTVVKILVGQSTSSTSPSGGSGGSFVSTGTVPLIVAGGVGGCGITPPVGNAVYRVGSPLLPGQSAPGGAQGGVNGGGGAAANTLAGGNNLVPGATSTGTIWGGGGGGFYSDGGGFDNGLYLGGRSFLNGGVGGDAAAPGNSPGGFGGGGGAGNRSGGGGGYNGGGSPTLAGGFPITSYVGAGGSSYNAGTNQFNSYIPHPNNSHVVITFTCNMSAFATPMLCSVGSATLSTNAISNYSWSSAAGALGTSSSIVVSPTVTTTYSVSATSSVGCPASTVITVNVPPPTSVAVAASSPTACAGAGISFTASGFAGLGPYTYSWSGGPQTSTYLATQPLSGAYVYTVTSTDANLCVAANTVAVGFVNNPTLSVADVSVCPGETGTLSVSGAVAYFWSPGNLSSNTFTASPGLSSIYTVTGSSSVGCISTATTQIVVKPLPVLSFNTFSITCASLGSATVSASGGFGPYSFTWMPGGQTTQTVNNLNPNTYSLTVFDAGTGCTSTATTLFTSLIPLTGNINSGSLTCHGVSTGSANATNLAGGSGTEHYLWSNGINSYTVPNPQNLSAGNWSATVTDALTGCQVFSVLAISQPPALTLNIAANTLTNCAGTNIVLTGTNSGGTLGFTYTWTNGPPSYTHTVSEAIAGTYIYTLSSTDANTCTTTNTISVDFIVNPTLSVSSVSICPMAIGTITVSGATSYTWSNNTNATTLSDSPAVNSYYTVTGSALGCTSTAGGFIILYPQPVAFITNNTLLCQSGDLLLSGSGGNTYSWAGPQSFTSAVKDPTIATVLPANSGVYNLTVTSVNGCTATAGKNLTIYPTPTLSASGATVCSSQTLQLSASADAGTSYLWSGPQSFTSNLQSPQIATPALNQSGNYTLKITSAAGCTNSAVVQASIVPPPSLTVALSSNSLCAEAFNGSPNTITLTSSGAATYTLTTPNMVLSNPSGSVSSIKNQPPFNGIGSATLEGSNGVCTVSTTVSFSVISNPTVGVNSNTPVICAGESFTYTSFGALSYTWGPNSPGITTYSTGGVAVANPSINSVFSVFGGSLGCNSANKTTTITVRPLPKFSVLPQNPTICLNESLILNANGDAETYTWWPYVGLSSLSGQTVSASPKTQQSYTVIGSLNSCTKLAVVTVSVLPLPLVSASILKSKVCLNEEVTLQGSGAETYYWLGENSDFEGQSVTFKANSPAFAGVYTLTGSDKNNCRNNATAELTVYLLPQGILQGKLQGCAPLESDFSYSPEKSAVKAQWQVEGKTYPTKFTHPFTSPGVYTITGSFVDSVTTCRNIKTFFVEAYEKPIADFSFLPEKPVENLDEVIFTNTSRGEEQTKWAWYFVNNKGSQSQNQNTSYLFEEPGLYPIAMVVKNKWGCADTVVKAIKIQSDLAVYVPNVFTPNEDELNDIFLPIIRGIKLYELMIFDRWGVKVFSTTDLQAGWDGTYRGEPCKQDVYVWKISLSSLNGEMKTMSGQVLLNR